MKKHFILDTNVLLYNPNAIFSFSDNTIVIPIEVIEELDGFKRDVSDLGQNARMVAQALDKLRRKGKLGEGVRLDNGGLLRVFAEKQEDYLGQTGLHLRNRSDSRILNLAIQLNEQYPQQPTIIVTKSINLRLKADALGIYAEDYEEPLFSDWDPYTGYHRIEAPADEIKQFNEEGSWSAAGRNFAPNEFVLLQDEAKSKLAGLGRIDGEKAEDLVPLGKLESEGVLGIRPLNVAQTFALEALLNDEITLVTLLGKAGTGKTLLAVAVGLHKIFKEDRYNRLLVSRPTLPMGRDIGYLPGDIEEKMRPWMHPITDAIELIRELDRRNAKRWLPADILECDEVGIEPLTYIRGRSIPHQYIVIDEAQNLTPLEVKTIITRVGVGTKIVLTGDVEQIDNPYVDSVSNGLVYLVNHFRHRKVAAHVTLAKGERSQLAELAADLL